VAANIDSSMAAGFLKAPFFVAWDRAAAPGLHRRKRVGAWSSFREMDQPWGRGDLPTILVVCPSDKEIAQWSEASVASADRRMVRPLRVLLTTVEALFSEGPLSAIWRRSADGRASGLLEMLAWRWEMPPEAHSRLSLAAGPLPKLNPSSPSAPQSNHSPSRMESEGDLSRFLVAGLEKRVLEWLAFHPLLAVWDLQVLLHSSQAHVESVLHNLSQMNLVDSVGTHIAGDDPPSRRYFLTEGGLRLLAERDSVPIVRYAKYGSVAAAMPLGQGGGRLQTLLRQIEHTVGSNRFFVRLVRDGAAGDSTLVHWAGFAEASRQFAFGGSRHWLRPDGAADLHHGGRTYRLLLEWDRATMRWPQMDAKCRLYAAYYASLAHATAGSRCPATLIVTSSPHREATIRRSLDVALAERGSPPASILTSVASLVEGVGSFGPVWQTGRRPGRIGLLEALRHPEPVAVQEAVLL
jgi:hypothetical protein